jgi:hypothetical protein
MQSDRAITEHGDAILARFGPAPVRPSGGLSQTQTTAASSRSLPAAVHAHGLVGHLGLVALAYQQAPGAVALAGAHRGHRQALAEKLYGRAQLVVALLHRHGGVGQVGRHATAAQVSLDALGAPPLQRPLVLGEALCEAGIVQVSGRLELADRMLDRLRLDPPALEAGPQLGDRAVARGDGPVCELDGPFVLGAGGSAACPVERERVAAQAALSWTSPVSGSTPGGGPAGFSTAATGGSWPMPRASRTLASISLALSGFSRR